MRSLWLDCASTKKSFNLYYFRFLAVNIIIDYHVLREHVRDDGLLNAEHFTDHDVPASNGEPGCF